MSEPIEGTGSPEPVLKGLDAWWTVLLIDPIAARLARGVTDVRLVTPTGLTVAAHLLGLLSTALFVAGELVLAAVLFELRFVLDCADGKLARLRRSASARGAYLDFVGDYLVVGAALVGLVVHLGWAGDVPLPIAVGLPAAFLAHITAGQARQLEVVAAGMTDRPPVQRLPGGYRAWMAARRLRPAPSRIEAEHGLLAVAPVLAVVLDEPAILAFAAWAGTGYFAYRALRISVGAYRVAAARDRARAGS